MSIVGLQAFAVAQTMPPPVESKPPAAGAPGSPPAPGGKPPGAQPQPQRQPPPPGYQQPPPGYQQRPQPPPPGYPPAPPGYQQPPPGYQQPPPGYQQQPPPQPPGYQPPPPGYYQPPPAYYPPPGYYPPGYAYQPPPPLPPAPPRPPPRTHGFLAMPYLGLATQTGEQGIRYSSGAIFGALLGGRLNRAFSLNGEFRIDSLDFKNTPTYESPSGTELDIGVSPLFHAQFATGEFLVGPKLSFFTHQERYIQNDINNFETNYYVNWTGWSTGFNAGLFFAVSRFMSLGGMVSYTLRLPTEACTRTAFSTEVCESGDYPSVNVLGFHAAALF